MQAFAAQANGRLYAAPAVAPAKVMFRPPSNMLCDSSIHDCTDELGRSAFLMMLFPAEQPIPVVLPLLPVDDSPRRFKQCLG